jgi:hypothetical protein
MAYSTIFDTLHPFLSVVTNRRSIVCTTQARHQIMIYLLFLVIQVTKNSLDDLVSGEQFIQNCATPQFLKRDVAYQFNHKK